MTSFKDILKHFRVVKLRDNNYSTAEEHNDKSKQQFLFVCKRCKSQSEPMNVTQNLQYRLSLHLTKYCKPSANNTSEQQQEMQQQQGPAE